MQLPIFSQTDWELAPHYFQLFARQTIENLDVFRNFMESAELEIAANQSIRSDIITLKNKQLEIIATCENTQHSIDQKANYLKLMHEQHEDSVTKQCSTMQNQLKYIEDLYAAKFAQLKGEVEKTTVNVNQTMLTKQSEIDYLAGKFKQQNEDVTNLSNLFRDQINQFYQKQAIYAEEFDSSKSKIEQTKNQLIKIEREVTQKLQDVEQNYFVGLIGRILKCENEVNSYKGRLQQILECEAGLKVDYDASQQQVQQVEQRCIENQLNLQTQIKNLQSLQNQIDNSNIELDKIKQRTSQIKAGFEDQYIKEVQQRAEFTSEIEKIVNVLGEQMSQLEDDLSRKINYCNDQVVQAGLLDQYNSFKKMKYQSDLEKLMEQGVIEVGQVKLIQAVVMRLKELENQLAWYVAGR
ncbi:Conserved_hypothetical protein [Hexamita inflata]|uniref:Uncharacterized protein n=1 Tax=Hexamita inflata TaxID=28002 RepID=A0AA86QHT0_9EUKA|nr:Conserved hypothetical protein [Hexamita inflata]CAI9959551.1 Conserved hypothetical protein [Hexamita inflata]